ncbi:isoprenylcysteine carboxyl methyltransferase family protein [Bacillus xiapuensis]|uniref:isoprenylcysteine carboxyl methyltransferase family protein n=1 Tax=Bacillus xiapuensis TaxID=2014075 RepID=UPI000C236868|nr:isoprenylcysteine carboxylmethyltransferase family protein [Bacillus xiapuensis]
MFFFLFFSFLVIQRIGELVYAKRNERWMKRRGAQEFGASHYPLIVLLHASFFIALWIEVQWKQMQLHPLWPLIFCVFLVLQMIRLWTISSLGRYWNTKILVLKHEKAVNKGPFKYVRHPNYLVVTGELILIPLMFQAYGTLVLYFILNQMMLAIRIPVEEKALNQWTDYSEAFTKR